MSRHLAHLAAAALVAAACARDATAPETARKPEPSALLVSSLHGYQASVLPLRSGMAINSSGAIVGITPEGTGVYYANGVTTVLLPLTAFNTVTPTDLLDDGRIIAREDASSGSAVPKALYYPGPTLSAVNIAPASWAHPASINSQGVVVGWYRPAGPQGAAVGFRWTPGSSGVTSIHPAGCEESYPYDISESGYVMGRVVCANTTRWYRWNPGGASGVLLPPDVTWAYQALESGRVLVQHPWYRSETWEPTSGFLGAGPSPNTLSVEKISPNGRYVGTYRDPITNDSRAWTSIGTGQATTLPLPAGFESAYVRDVNACGTILGVGHRASDGQLRAIVWRRSFACDLTLGTASTF